MEKKIMKAMYSSIVSKDPIRPIMTGVFFDQNCCVATDTHMLVVFNHTNPKFVGKVMEKKFPASFPTTTVCFRRRNGSPSFTRALTSHNSRKPAHGSADSPVSPKKTAW